jgi:hypothetical protein
MRGEDRSVPPDEIEFWALPGSAVAMRGCDPYRVGIFGGPLSQGSRCAATLGFELQRLWR